MFRFRAVILRFSRTSRLWTETAIFFNRFLNNGIAVVLRIDTKYILRYNKVTTFNFRIYHRAHTPCRRYAVSRYLKFLWFLRLGVVTLRNGMLTGVVLEMERLFFILSLHAEECRIVFWTFGKSTEWNWCWWANKFVRWSKRWTAKVNRRNSFFVRWSNR